MRTRLIRIMKPLHAIPVENPAQPGTPDINYIDGWIECKWLRSWPKKKNSPVTITHFTQRQRIWLKKRVAHGGNCWLFLQCGRQWLIFDGRVAAEIVGKVPRYELFRNAIRYWRVGLNEEELVSWLWQQNIR